MQLVCHTHPVRSEHFISLSCISECFRGPEFCLRYFQLLAAAALATVTRAVSERRDEQHKCFTVGCSGGGKTGNNKVHIRVTLKSILSVCDINSVRVCSMCWSLLRWFCGYWSQMNRTGSGKRENTLSIDPCRPWNSRWAPMHFIIHHFACSPWSLWQHLVFLFSQMLPSKESWLLSQYWGGAACAKLLQPEDRVPPSVLYGPRYESSLGYPAGPTVYTAIPLVPPPNILLKC